MFKNLNRTAFAAMLALAFASAQVARAQTPAQTATPATTPSTAQSGATATTQTAAPAATPTPLPPTGMQHTADGHEYAPLLEQKINYKDWTFKSMKDGSDVDLRNAMQGKKLVAVVYFAPWCPNWRAEAPVIARLYDKYKADGFDVVAVSEYATADDARNYFQSQGGAPYTVVVESDSRDARDKTTHYTYRQSVGDPRRWGSPFNVFLEPAKLNKTGDVLTEKAWVVGGELIEKDVEQFVRQRLGLSEQSAVEPCREEPAKADAKKQ
ncbi:MAG TPA: TlpA disulfide reductase family protein [Pyrinomonadaceae bacterium]|jgi:thiol-disulfide isomerase/thioredoxin|nr:TlpA disulfide reductase family protein [Pyrinomonadaceae bacterium]